MDQQEAPKPPRPIRSDSASNSGSSGGEDNDAHMPFPRSTELQAPKPLRPYLMKRRSSGPLLVPRDSSQVGPVPVHLEPGDVRAMSPRRTGEDIEHLSQEAREELHRHAQALQDSLLTIFNRIEAVKEEHDKLDNNNKFLQKYIGDLMSTSKITASTSSARGRK